MLSALYVAFFSKPYPAWSCVKAKLASLNIRVEIESAARKPKSPSAAEAG